MKTKNLFKSVGAVLAGFITVALFSVGTDAVLEALGLFPPQTEPGKYAAWMLAVALIYRSMYTVMGGYVTARVAPRNPQGHVLALMILGGIGGVAGAIGGWSLGNHWYPVLLAITGPFFVWLGGRASIGKK